MAGSETTVRRGRTFGDSYARRLVTVIDDRIARAVRSESGTETTWGQVAAVSGDGQTASAYLYGDVVNPSVGFRITGSEVLTVGDKIKVAISARGDKYVSERVVTSSYRKVEIDMATGEIRTGDGTVPPTARITSTGLSLAHSALTGVTADQHHARSHDHSNASDDNTIAPVEVTIGSTPDIRLLRTATKTLTIDDAAAGAITLALPATSSLLFGGDAALSRGAANRLDLAAGDSFQISDTGNLQWSDVTLSRGAADRLDLASGDSFRLSDTGQLQWSDVALSRGAANRLDLASGDSFQLSDTSNLQWSDIALSRGAANRLDLASGDSFRFSDTGQLQWSDIVISRSAANTLLLAAGDRVQHDPVGCIANRTSTQSITTATWTGIAFSATDISDAFAMHDPATNNTRFVAPWAGTFLLTITMSMAGFTGLILMGYDVNAAGTLAPGAGEYLEFVGSTVIAPAMTGTWIVELNASDYIEFGVFHNQGGNQNTGADIRGCMFYLGERV